MSNLRTVARVLGGVVEVDRGETFDHHPQSITVDSSISEAHFNNVRCSQKHLLLHIVEMRR